MAGRISDDQAIPKPNAVDRHTFVRDIARALLQAAGAAEEDMVPRVEHFLGGVIHYLLGRIHNRPELPRERALRRRKAPLVPLVNGLLKRQRKTMGNYSETLQEWFSGLIEECEAGKYNPLAAWAFTALLRTQPRQTVQTTDLAKRSFRLDLGMPA